MSAVVHECHMNNTNSPNIVSSFNLPDVISSSFYDNVCDCTYYNTSTFTPDFQPHLSLFILHVNIKSLLRNLHRLEDLLLLIKYPPDVLCITETKIKNNPLRNITIPGYDFFHADSPTNAGGVAIY